MAAEALVVLVHANLAASLALMVIFLARGPVRRALGVHTAYALWAMAPLAALGSLMPLDFACGPIGALEAATDGLRLWLSSGARGVWIVGFWGAGALASAALAALSHIRYQTAEKCGRAGPAAIGVVLPRLVVPADFQDRFTAGEWRLVRAHERAHIDRLDGRWIALAALAQWICWFNPLAHVAVRAFRLDQELACDATVMERLPGERRRYAEALLRTQANRSAPVFGASWKGRASLETRIRMLSSRAPSLRRTELGQDVLALLWVGAFIAAWAVQAPPRLPADFTSVLAREALPDLELPARR